MNVHEPIEAFWWRRFYLGWALFLLVLGAINATSVHMEHLRESMALPLWRPFVNEYTGVGMLGLLIPLVVWFDRVYPFRRDAWHLALPAHLIATIPFALLHTAGFVAMRKLAYPLFDAHYVFGDLSFELLYEYRKVLRGYILVVLSLQGFRHYVMLRRLLDMPEAESASGDAAPRAGESQRFLARHKHRDILVNASDIRYVESAGNYVILHTPQGELRLRETMEVIERRLDPAHFVRIHRTHIVHMDAVKEIQPWFHGDRRIVLHDGTVLNLSRRYRDRLEERLAN